MKKGYLAQPAQQGFYYHSENARKNQAFILLTGDTTHTWTVR